MAIHYKFVVYVPVTHAEEVRQAMGEAGAGEIGNYSFTSFSVRGVGRFKPGPGAHPAIGKVGDLTEVEEERIETVVSKEQVSEVLAAIERVHPYEEIAYDLYPLEQKTD